MSGPFFFIIIFSEFIFLFSRTTFVSVCVVLCVCASARCDVFKCPSPLYSIFYSPFCPYSRRSSCSSKLVGCFPFLKDFMRQPPHPPLAPNVNLKKKKKSKKRKTIQTEPMAAVVPLRRFVRGEKSTFSSGLLTLQPRLSVLKDVHQ